MIRFGSKRWCAAIQAGLTEVPVVLALRAHDAYDQVAENLKRHGLSPLDPAWFIRGRAEAGDANATIAKRLGIDPTTVAHHLALLDWPPVLDAALQTGRCTSPRTLYELSKLHVEQPCRVVELMAGSDPVAKLRDATPIAAAATGGPGTAEPRPDRTGQMLARANALCDRLDGALQRLGQAGATALPPDEMAGLRQRVVALASRLDT